jgi:thioredoxin reductase
MQHDVIIVGGSYAGLSAALRLGRARRRVLVIDAGQRRNRAASHAHGFLGHDGRPPGEIAAQGRAEVLAYPTVALVETTATAARKVITTDAQKATTVPGVYACGDAAYASVSVALAVGDGVRAGVSAHQSLIFR